MRAVLTKVTSASVTIDGQVVGRIGKGFLILLGVGPNDTEVTLVNTARIQNSLCFSYQTDPAESV